jgi:two-component system, LuxR family, sensor kinase FixL
MTVSGGASEADLKAPAAAFGGSPLLAVIAAAFALGIFAFDTATTLDIAIAVLYVVVVLLSANFLQRRGVLIVASGCMVLTVLAYVLSHPIEADTALVRVVMSLSAIAATAFLALKNQAANMAVREQARLLDLTHDTIFVRDMGDVITYWNRGAEELYGWRRDEAVGKVSHQLMKTVFPVPLEDITAELLRVGRWEGELIHTKRDGARLTLSSRWSLQRDERGRPVATMETNNDITERNHAQEALRRTQAELAHVNRVMTLGELTASIAHEVNQPLAGIVTNGAASLRWLDRKPPDLDEVRGAVQSMIDDGMRASEVIKRIRALSKKTELQKVRLNVNELIDDVVRLVEREMLDQLISLRLEVAPALPAVLGDRVQLQQVIINLVMNGMEAMAAVTGRPRELVIQAHRHEGEQVLIAVRDSGVGVEPQLIDNLFNAFFTTKPNGMGMGLSISRSIIEAHGGRIWATRNSGAGATFQFTLPWYREAAS